MLSPSVATRVLGRMRAPAEEALSPRELEILQAVARGLSNKEIGRRLYVSEATVKTHLLRVFSKLGVDDRTAAVTVALERGIIRQLRGDTAGARADWERTIEVAPDSSAADLAQQNLALNEAGPRRR